MSDAAVSPDPRLEEETGAGQESSSDGKRDQEFLERLAERAKWDAYYSQHPVSDDSTGQVHYAAIAQELARLLPNGGSILEVGCGAGGQSLALARLERFDIALMDFSAPALQCAEAAFRRENRAAHFLRGDVFDRGSPEYDLVFNAGSLEHYSAEQQIAFLRGMASRSRRFVLALVPNNLCYWYWLWRIHAVAQDNWPFGRETPVSDLSAVFRQAGLSFLGEAFLGETWTEDFITSLGGMDAALRGQILRVHRSAVIAQAQKAYLYGALGAVDTSLTIPAGSAFAVGLPKPVVGEPEWQTAQADLLGARQNGERLRADLLGARQNGERFRADLVAARQDAERLRKAGENAERKWRQATAALTQALDMLEAVRQMRTMRWVRRAGFVYQHLLHGPWSARRAAIRAVWRQASHQGGAVPSVDLLAPIVQHLAAAKSLHGSPGASGANPARDGTADPSATCGAVTGDQPVCAPDVGPEPDALRKRIAELEQETFDSRARAPTPPDERQPLAEQLRVAREAEAHARSELQRIETSLGWRIVKSGNAWVDRLRLRWAANAVDRWVRALRQNGLRRKDLLTRQVPRRRPEHAATDLPDVIVWGVIDWHFRIQRPQHLAAGLARSGRRVFYVSAMLVDCRQSGFRAEKLDDRGRLFQIRLHANHAPAIYASPGSPEVLDQLHAGLAALLDWADVGPAVCLVQHPFWFPLAAAVPDSRLVYDCMDHHQGFGGMQSSMLDQERGLLSACDLAIVSSETLQKACAPYAARTTLIRNACEYAHFSARPRRGRIPAERRKVIGYYGAIATWFDDALVATVARAFPECSVVLIGADSAGVARRLAGLPNVRCVDEVPYNKLPGYLHTFDVCLLPFRIEPLTQATNPVKVYEYLAAGKPVVAVSLPEMAQFGDLIDVTHDPESFVAGVRRHLESPNPEAASARQAFAREQTWAHRVAALLDAMAGIPDPPVSVIVVTYNNIELTRTCLASIERYSGYGPLEVIVVDNASTDGTPVFLNTWAAAAPGRRVILNADNKGFAAANNQGLASATGEFLIMLNNDTHVTPGWIRTLVNHLRRNPDIGILGPVTNNIGNEARVPLSYATMAGMLKQSRAYTRAHAGKLFGLDTTALFCAAIPRRTYEKVGPLDEAFGTGYFEDDDYCRRIERAGLRVMCAEDAFVHHHLSASFNRLQADRRKELFERNRLIYERKWGAWKPHRPRPV